MAQISARGLILDLDIYYVESRLIPVDPSALDAQSKGFPD